MIQKSVRKRIICILLIVCCTATCFNSCKIETQAATKDVTNSITGKHNIKALCKCFDSLCGVELTYQMEVGQKKKYNFSKASTRRYVIRLSYSGGWKAGFERHGGIDINTSSKYVFGKGTSNVDVMYANLGDGELPEFNLSKIYKLSSERYKVNINVYQFTSHIHNNDTRHRTGKLTVILKKKPKSEYGYIVKSMTLKKIADL